MKIKKVHIDRLFSALNKYYKSMSLYEFWYKHDLQGINNAIEVSGFSKDVNDWIWEKEVVPFAIF